MFKNILQESFKNSLYILNIYGQTLYTVNHNILKFYQNSVKVMKIAEIKNNDVFRDHSAGCKLCKLKYLACLLSHFLISIFFTNFWYFSSSR